MIDTRTIEEQKKAAEACYKAYRARKSRRTCSGCHLDCYCQMPHDTVIGIARIVPVEILA